MYRAQPCLERRQKNLFCGDYSGLRIKVHRKYNMNCLRALLWKHILTESLNPFPKSNSPKSGKMRKLHYSTCLFR